jgi:hypothetical protein
VRLTVEPSSARCEIVPVFPLPGQAVRESRPAIRVRFTRGQGGPDPGSVYVFLDRADRTAQSRLEDSELLLVPPAPLAAGPHLLVVAARSRSGA